MACYDVSMSCWCADVVSYCTHTNSLHILSADGHIRGFELTTLSEYIELLLQPESILGAASACLDHVDIIKQHGMLLHRVQELLPPNHHITQVCRSDNNLGTAISHIPY